MKSRFLKLYKYGGWMEAAKKNWASEFVLCI